MSTDNTVFLVQSQGELLDIRRTALNEANTLCMKGVILPSAVVGWAAIFEKYLIEGQKF